MVAYATPSTTSARRLSDYDHVRLLTRSRVAWEYLRRNREYVIDWHLSAPGRPQPIRLTDETILLRARRRFLHAEAWGLCTFRRSRS
ncbi:MAG: hypothetical protein RIC85_05870 [Gammaproteobacteria bacterium]